MRILSLIIPFLALLLVTRQGDPTHGPDFKISCNVCHSPESWKLDYEIYSFDHNTTNLPLVGQHNNINCRLCHVSLVFSEAGTECISCHTDMHEQTVGTDCARCHTPVSWIVSNITDIHRQGRFPLLGAHYTADCMECHPSASSLRFEPLSVECVSCHMEEYQAASNPNHVEGNISTDCAQCHSMTAFDWGGEGFSHHFFPLTGGHALPECATCHKENDYAGLSSECISCHAEDYNTASNPDHVASNFPTDCMVCHTTMPGWKPAKFDHSSFPLTQGHAIAECASCHTESDYSNISSECASCHLDDFNATTNPNHVAAGISNNCLTCHTTLPGWKPADFPIHDSQFFPVYSGRHRGTWDNCSDCHQDLNNYASFTCIACHEHNRSETDSHHREVRDYQYNSMACLDCHPVGRAED